MLLQFVSNASFSANSQERRAFLALLVFELRLDDGEWIEPVGEKVVVERAGRFVQFVDLGRIAANVADRSRFEASSGIGRTEDVVVAHDGYGERSRARNDATDSASNVVLDDWVE